MKSRIVGLLAAALLLCAPLPARADTITITGGLHETDFIVASLNLISDRFSLSLMGGRPLTLDFPSPGFGPDGTLDFTTPVNGDFTRGVGGTIDGVSYENVTATTHLLFSTVPVSLPNGAPDHFVGTLRTPFTLSGTIRISSSGNLLLQGDLAGSGTLEAGGNVNTNHSSAPRFEAEQVFFRFE